jgi:hypothetical protein
MSNNLGKEGKALLKRNITSKTAQAVEVHIGHREETNSSWGDACAASITSHKPASKTAIVAMNAKAVSSKVQSDHVVRVGHHDDSSWGDQCNMFKPTATKSKAPLKPAAV